MKSIAIALALSCVFCSVATAQVGVGDGFINLEYTPETGEVNILTNGQMLWTLEIKSASGLWGGTAPQTIVAPIDSNGLFNVYTPDKLFRLDAGGFGDLELGEVFPIGLTADFIALDLRADGSPVGGGRLPVVNGKQLGIITASSSGAVPEPSTFLVWGMLGAIFSVASLKHRQKS